MKKGMFQKLLPHFIAVLTFLIVALIYCKPVLQGKVLHQSDVVLWRAMAQNSFQYKDTHGHFPLWTTGMFSGMPAYQIALEPHVVGSPGILYFLFTLNLPKPISFFFLACICFYFLSQTLRISPYIGIIGALAYAYATYNPVIIAVGHETKMNSIALMPAFIGSLILVYDKKYWWGAALTALFTMLLVSFNHMQIIYYTLIIAGFMTVGYLVHWIRKQDYKHIILAGAIAIGAGMLGVFCNAVNIFTTYEYSKETIRGGSALADKTSNFTKSGLSEDYAFDYSMYKSEPFVMLIPKMFGGSDGLEMPQENSKAVEALSQMPQQLAQQLQYNLRFYWGGIGGTSGPPYVGAIICFLTLIGFFLLDNKHKWWILAACVIAIVMSWGKYFEGFNELLLKYLPLYNKFRAPSMIIVIPTFLFCMMAVLTLQKIITYENKAELWEKYKKGLLLTGGIFIILLLVYFSADYTSEQDKYLLKQASAAGEQVMEYVRSFLNGLKEDRRSLFMGSLIRSFLYIAAAAFVIWLSIKQKIQRWMLLSILGILAFIDVMSIDTQYLNSDNYQDEADVQNNYLPTPADQQILRDNSYYRVLDVRNGIQNAFQGEGAISAYFHHSIGGYHPAKLSIYQDLIEHQLYNFPNCLPTLDMLNTKYIIERDQSGKDTILTNPGALGPAWFVTAVRFEPTPAAVMNDLTSFSPKDTAIVFTADQNLVQYSPQPDSTANIVLIKNDNDEITYQSNAASKRFAVFSEIYYSKGWKAYIDGQETPIIRTDYALRGLSVPAGKHTIRFVFHPSSYYTGEKLATIASIIVFVLLIAAIVVTFRATGKPKG